MGVNLENIVAYKSIDELKPVKRSFTLRESASSKTAKHVRMGKFYEILTAALYGGVHTGGSRAETKQALRIECEEGITALEDGTLTTPDVVDWDKKIIWESRAWRSDQHSHLLTYQMDGYKGIQLFNPDFTINFALYRHRFQGIRSFRGTSDELCAGLSKLTLYGLIMPFSLALHFMSLPRNGIVYPYDGKSYDQCVCLRSSTGRRLLYEPQNVLHEAGVSLDNYSISYSIVHALRWRGDEQSAVISTFPVMRISENNHRAWIEKFMAQELRDIPF